MCSVALFHILHVICAYWFTEYIFYIILYNMLQEEAEINFKMCYYCLILLYFL